MMKAKANRKTVKKYGSELKILRDQQIIIQITMIKNIRISNSIQTVTYLWKKTRIVWHDNSC